MSRFLYEITTKSYYDSNYKDNILQTSEILDIIDKAKNDFPEHINKEVLDVLKEMKKNNELAPLFEVFLWFEYWFGEQR